MPQWPKKVDLINCDTHEMVSVTPQDASSGWLGATLGWPQRDRVALIYTRHVKNLFAKGLTSTFQKN